MAACFQDAVAAVLVAKTAAAMRSTEIESLVVAGGVGANRRLRAVLDESASKNGFKIYYPELEFCTDNGAMIALAGTLRLGSAISSLSFDVHPRWDLAELPQT